MAVPQNLSSAAEVKSLASDSVRLVQSSLMHRACSQQQSLAIPIFCFDTVSSLLPHDTPAFYLRLSTSELAQNVEGADNGHEDKGQHEYLQFQTRNKMGVASEAKPDMMWYETMHQQPRAPLKVLPRQLRRLGAKANCRERGGIELRRHSVRIQ